MTEKEKMLNGIPYNSITPELINKGLSSSEGTITKIQRLRF